MRKIVIQIWGIVPLLIGIKNMSINSLGNKGRCKARLIMGYCDAINFLWVSSIAREGEVRLHEIK